MYELLTGSHPIVGERNYSLEQYKDLLTSRDLQVDFQLDDREKYSDMARDFFSRVCHPKPNHRYNAATALRHPWITGNMEDSIPLKLNMNLEMCEELKRV